MTLQCPYELVDDGDMAFDPEVYQVAIAMCPPVHVSQDSAGKVRRLHHGFLGTGEIVMTWSDWEREVLRISGLAGKLPGNASALHMMGFRPEDAAPLLDTAHIADLVMACGWPRFIDPEKFDAERKAEAAHVLENNPLLDGALRGAMSADGAENPFVEFTPAWHAWNWGHEKRGDLA